MTTPEKVENLLAEDAELTDAERAALAELFRVAYEQIRFDNAAPGRLD